MKGRQLLTLLLLAGLVAGCGKVAGPPAPEPAPSPPVAEAPPAQVTPDPEPEPEPEPQPEPAQVLVAGQVQQGDFTPLTFDRPVEGPVTVSVTGLGEQPKVYWRGGVPVAFIAFSAYVGPGLYPVEVSWADGYWSGEIEVLYKAFTEDRLEVTEEQEEVYYDPRQEAEWNRLYSLRSTSSEEPFWSGLFAPPLAGELEVTTYFGEIRFVNGQETGRHSGMDFGAPEGTPILAPAPGRVVMAEELIVTGHTLVIDHGFNLYTTYYHCSQLDVAPGDWVETGEVIGLVGNTGFSTGPHLHWTATIGNTPVDPWPLTQQDPLTF